MFGVTPNTGRIQNISAIFKLLQKEAIHFWDVLGRKFGKQIRLMDFQNGGKQNAQEKLRGQM